MSGIDYRIEGIGFLFNVSSMKRDDTKKNFTALSGNDLATVLFHYLAFLCQIAIVTISEVFCLMRYGSVQNAEIHLFLLREP